MCCYGNPLTALPTQEEWLWGWDSTPGIVSVWAEPSGHASVWRRTGPELALVHERARYRPWLLLASLTDLKHLGAGLQPEAAPASDGAAEPDTKVRYRELEGSGELRFLVSAENSRVLSSAVLKGASRRLSRELRSLRELPAEEVLSLAPDEQYLIASGRSYFRGLAFDDLRRLSFDLETTGLDPDRDRIFL
ncbi:MAG TPA: hypothetical protein VJU61_21525, partial [Polyangiaceae bacterium]|nr:hypothetical protein [Polyangiaceae bacterium]